MRLGSWVAAAALVGASPASAARYFEFQVTGSANSGPLLGPDGVYALSYTSTDTYWFDSSLFSKDPNAPFNYLFASGYTGSAQNAISTPVQVVMAANSQLSGASIGTLTQPGGPAYSFSFNFADIPVGDSLQALPLAGGSFVYRTKPDPRYGTTYDTNTGQVVSILARATDVTPTLPRFSEQLAASVVPEPSIWATMMIGFGVVGAALRRRRPARRAAALPA